MKARTTPRNTQSRSRATYEGSLEGFFTDLQKSGVMNENSAQANAAVETFLRELRELIAETEHTRPAKAA